MQRWVAFLRGMNLGNRRLSNDELCEAFARFGIDDATAFQASGNVVFDAPDRSERKLRERIESGLERSLDYAVPTFLRSADEVRELAGHQPFAPQALAGSRGKVQVMLLQEEPAAADRKAVLALESEEDRLAFSERALFWLPSGGVLETDLDLEGIGKRLGLATMRTQGTLQRLARKFLADGS